MQNQRFNGKMKTDANGATNTDHALTNSTFREVVMAKNSLPNNHSTNNLGFRPEKHGLSRTRLYRTWKSMRNRCHLPTCTAFKNYGARGITVCDRWRFGERSQHPFLCFLEDMGNAPEGMSMERIDNDKGYSPENCKWATRLEQANNQRKNVVLTVDGKTLTVAEWCRELGLKDKRVYERLKAGMSAEQALSPHLITPAPPPKKPVAQFDIHRRFIRTFDSMYEAAMAISVTPSSISDACAGRRKTAGGYCWQRV